MANLTAPEFTGAIDVLCAHFGLERLRDRFAQMGAFTTRRGLNSAAALAERVHRLSGGLRLRVASTYAFSQLWGEMLNARMGEDGEKALEELADRVNACLTPTEGIVEGKEAELDEALAAYRARLEELAGADVARWDMLLKAVPAVADRLRGSAAS